MPSLLTLRDLSTTLTPHVTSQYVQEPAWNFTTKMRGDHLRQMELSGRIEPFGTAATLKGSVQQLKFTPEFCQSLPYEIAVQCAALNMLTGDISLEFGASYLVSRPEQFQFQVNGTLSNGRIADARFPQMILDDTTAHFSADQQGFRLQDLTARNGNATTLTLSAERRGYSPNAPLALNINAQRMMIGREWEKLLSEKLLAAWQKFLPVGVVNVVGSLEYDGTRWIPNGRLECVNVSFRYFKFPYRMDQTQGTLSCAGNHCTGHLTSYASGRRPVDIQIDVQNPGEQFTGEVKLNGREIPIDPSLLDAMTEKSHDVVNSLHAIGNFHFDMLLKRDDPKLKPNLTVNVDLQHCAMKYDKFPYPVSDINGRMVFQDGNWTFQNLLGFNDTGKIHCNGTLQPLPAGNHELKLAFRCDEVVLEPELRDALPEKVRSVWDSLQPRGYVDLEATVLHRSGEGKAAVAVTASPRGSSVSVTPVCFPLNFEKIHGKFHYRAGRLDFENVSAEQERLPISVAGYCEHNEQGQWHLRFEKLLADRVRVDRPTMQAALPPKLRKALAAEQLTGPINLSGKYDLWGQAGIEQATQCAWDWDLTLQDCSIGQECRLEHAAGTVRLVGNYLAGQFRAQGEVNLDSVFCKEMQFTQVRGPLWLDEQQLLFGQAAAEKSQQKPNPYQTQHITAKCYGGTALADIAVALGEVPRFTLQAAVNDGDIAQFAQEQIPGKQKLRGKVDLAINVSGSAAGKNTLNGQGQLKLHDANIYEVPVMFALFKRLSVRDPERSAFDAGDIKFRIDGEHLYLDHIEMSGTPFSLLGTGEMNFNPRAATRL